MFRLKNLLAGCVALMLAVALTGCTSGGTDIPVPYTPYDDGLTIGIQENNNWIGGKEQTHVMPSASMTVSANKRHTPTKPCNLIKEIVTLSPVSSIPGAKPEAIALDPAVDCNETSGITSMVLPAGQYTVKIDGVLLGTLTVVVKDRK